MMRDHQTPALEAGATAPVDARAAAVRLGVALTAGVAITAAFAGGASAMAAALWGGATGAASFISMARGLHALMGLGEGDLVTPQSGRRRALIGFTARHVSIGIALLAGLLWLRLPPIWLVAGVTAWPLSAWLCAALAAWRTDSVPGA